MKRYSLGSMMRAGAWGALLGGAAGFSLGLLLAPEEGQKVRRRLAYQLEHLLVQFRQVLDQVVGPEHENQARRSGDALVADAREEADRIQADIEALLVKMRH